MKILVLGAGKMGRGAVHDLIVNSPDVAQVTVADQDLQSVRIISDLYNEKGCVGRQFDATNYQKTVELMRGHDAAISCVPYFYNLQLAKAAIEARVNFCDLGGNNDVVAQELALDAKAKTAGINIIPDCGLAPGMVSVLAMHGAQQFDELDSLKIRVGGLPQNPKPPLDYQLVFSVEGLINEYLEPARVIRAGKIAHVESLTEIETLEFDGFPALEAFQTSSGTSTLPETFLGKIGELDYKTIRYAGHCEKVKTLFDMGLADSQPLSVSTSNGETVKIAPRAFFGELLMRALPRDEPDLVLIRLEFRGSSVNQTKTLRYDIVDRFDHETGLTAMQRTTAFPASIIAQMMARGETARRGATPQETVIPPDKFVRELAARNITVSS